MAYKEFKEGEHPRGFVGIVVSSNFSAFRNCMHFPFHESTTAKEKAALRREAKTWDAEMTRKAVEAKLRHIELAKPFNHSHSEHSTGVRGISFRERYNVDGDHIGYTLIMNIRHENRRLSRSCSVDMDLSDLPHKWENLIKLYARHKRLKRWKHLLDRTPTV